MIETITIIALWVITYKTVIEPAWNEADEKEKQDF